MYAYFNTVDGTQPLYVNRFELIDINKSTNKVNIITSQWHILQIAYAKVQFILNTYILYRMRIEVNTWTVVQPYCRRQNWTLNTHQKLCIGILIKLLLFDNIEYMYCGGEMKHICIKCIYISISEWVSEWVNSSVYACRSSIVLKFSTLCMEIRNNHNNWTIWIKALGRFDR